MRNTSLLLGTVALAFAASAASAADIVFDEPPAPVAPAPLIYDWSGVYVGVHGGYVRTRLGLPGNFGTENFDGGLIGAHLGANWQVDSWVFGVEGDVSYTFNENTYFYPNFGDVDVGTDWQGSIRARAGYAIDRTLLYATGGLAITQGYVETVGFDESETFTGWTVGAGVEHAFTDNWTARVEYRYSDYGSKDFGLGFGDYDLSEHSIRAGVSFKF